MARPFLLFDRQPLQLAIRTELELFEIGLGKQERSLQVLQQEDEYYRNEQIRLAEEITNLQNQIASLKEVLKEEERLRMNKDEYDVVAKEILKYPSREELNRNLDKVSGEIEALGEQQAEIQRLIEKNAIAGYEAIRGVKLLRQDVDTDIKSIQ